MTSTFSIEDLKQKGRKFFHPQALVKIVRIENRTKYLLPTAIQACPCNENLHFFFF